MCCPTCGEDAQTRAKFCWNCGEPIVHIELASEATAPRMDLPSEAETVTSAASTGKSSRPNFGARDSGDQSEADCQHLELLAVWGDVQARLELGRRCELGDGAPQDYRKAADWYQQSADQGNPEAQVALANLYENGRGVEPDPRTALRWYLKAAGQGYPGARLRYDTLDAKEGRASAQFAMGCRCQDGQDVCQNMADAAEWYRLAATQGYPPISVAFCRLPDSQRGGGWECWWRAKIL
jgi:TPR repeat protein